MNKRIQELAEQAGAFADSLVGKHGERAEFDAAFEQKFAELVIKETMQVVAKNTAWNGYLNAAEAVIEHFKDEE
jgi:crotonobetainyl-CoA:carnitine CoA-transferase CaiB-like acyl-CoA transferase